MHVTFPAYRLGNAAMNATLRFSDGVPGENRTIVLGNLSLHLDSFRTTLSGRAVDLTHHEFELLRIFCVQAGRVIPYESLVRELWDLSGRSAVRHLNVIVHRLRTKLTGLSPYSIETVRGRGYGLLEVDWPPARRAE